MAGLFKWSARKPEAPPARVAPPVAELAASDPPATSKVLPRFLSALSHSPSPVILDLGPVVGANVAFFGERFACKIHVQDLFAEVERHAKAGTQAALVPAMLARLTQADESVDGILCWDLFDFLDRGSGRALASRLARLVRQGGALHGFFGTTQGEVSLYSRYTMEAADAFRVRTRPATPVKRTVLLTGDIIKMFDGLTVAESVLLKSKTRETLFRRT
jgi:hypothetical protein